MQKKHLQSWLEAETSKERLDTENWEWAVEILQAEFRDVRIPTEFTWKPMVLIPKGNGEFWGIRIVEVLCKELLVLINQRIGEVLQFHKILHGLRAGRGMENSSLEVKLLQQLKETREEVLYKVFLDLRKAYDTLDRAICMDILVGYGVSLRMERILRYYWDHL